MLKLPLKPFQEQVTADMVARKQALLAFPLGSGKTVVALSAVETLMDRGDIREPGIILAGASLKYQWAGEIDKFTNSKCLVVSGPPKKRQEIYAQFLDWRNTGIDYLIVTYTTCTNDAKIFATLPKGFVIADEVISIKSFRSNRSKTIKALFKNTPVRFGLSGTPIENGKPEELFSEMEFVDPSVLGKFHHFEKAFIVRNKWGGVSHYRNMPLLHKTAKKAVFFRASDDQEIAKEMPEEILKPPIAIDLDAQTKKLYRKIALAISNDLAVMAAAPGGSFDLAAYYAGGDQGTSERDAMRGMLMSKITVARMLLDHPDLVRASAENFEIDNGGSSYAAELAAEGFLDPVKKAPKLDALVDVAQRALVDPKAKLVIFSVYRGMLDIINKELGVRAVVYHGGLSSEERHIRKTQFQEDPDTRIFISSDAGGVGVDLPQANCLINYDLPWQAGALEQRNARPRRVSSSWSHIIIEQLLVRQTLEEWQYDMLAQKSAVSRAILQGKGINKDGGVGATLDSLLSYLRVA